MRFPDLLPSERSVSLATVLAGQQSLTMTLLEVMLL